LILPAEMESFQDLRNRRAVNVASMLSLGTVRVHGSVHKSSLQEDAMESDRDIPPPYRLHVHQMEDVECMAAVEARESLPMRGGIILTHVGVLCEPPGSGKMVIMAAHIASAPMPDSDSAFVRGYDSVRGAPMERARICGGHAVQVVGHESVRTYVPPVYVPLTVVVTTHTSAVDWEECSQRMGSRVRLIASRAALRAFQKDFDSLPGSCDVVVVSRPFCKALAGHLAFKRVGRLVFDDAQRTCTSRVDISACFVWFITGSPSHLLENTRCLPFMLRDAFDSECIRWLDDPSPLFVFHSKDEVDASMGVEYPMNCVYHPGPLRLEDQPSLAATYCPSPPDIPAKLVVAHHVPVWSYADAPYLVQPTRKTRLLQELQGMEGCMVCTEPSEGSTCLLTCCTRLLCCNCLWKIVHTSATCPMCRTPLTKKGASIALISDSLKSPLNVAHFYSSIGTLENLAFILGRMKAGTRLLLFAHCNELWIESMQLTLRQFICFQLRFRVVDFSGTAARVRSELAAFHSEAGDKVATVVTNHTNLEGMDLSSATDIVFYSVPSQDSYESILSRCINPSMGVHGGITCRPDSLVSGISLHILGCNQCTPSKCCFLHSSSALC
jgi:hypothetical protein